MRRGCTAIHPEAASLDVAGGCAVFVGAESPLTQAVGIGLNGPVQRGELEALETFFRSRGAKVSIDLCPLADPGLLPMLAERGYRVTEFNNVLVKRLAGTRDRVDTAGAARAAGGDATCGATRWAAASSTRAN